MDRHTRRDIRRAMGPEALDMVGRVVEALRIVEQRVKAHDIELDQRARDWVDHERRLDRVQARFNRDDARSCWARLWWVLRGR